MWPISPGAATNTRSGWCWAFSQITWSPRRSSFPITPLVLSYRKEDKLTHRDFLGSFMALGVERSVIGDIVVGEGQCVAFLREEMGSISSATSKKSAGWG